MCILIFMLYAHIIIGRVCCGNGVCGIIIENEERYLYLTK